MIQPMAISKGAELALLLLGGFHTMVAEVTVELERQGHPGVRPVHEFALRAIDGGAETASALGRRLAVSKQAAAKTLVALEEMKYVDREVDPDDGRRKRIRVTPRGHELMAVGGSLFDDVRRRWAKQIGAGELATLEAQLDKLVSHSTLVADDLTRDAETS
jgi:DNA-binding MarR family transcriptional regulator